MPRVDKILLKISKSILRYGYGFFFYYRVAPHRSVIKELRIFISLVCYRSIYIFLRETKTESIRPIGVSIIAESREGEGRKEERKEKENAFVNTRDLPIGSRARVHPDISRRATS